MKILLTLPALLRNPSRKPGGACQKKGVLMPELAQMWPLLVTSVAIYYFYRWVITDMNGR